MECYVKLFKAIHQKWIEWKHLAYYGKKLKTASRQTRTHKVTRVRSTDINGCVFFLSILYAQTLTFFLKRYLGESVVMCCLFKTFCNRFKERTQIQQPGTQCQLLGMAFLAPDEKFDEGLFFPNRDIGQIWITHPKLSDQPRLRF